MKKILKIIKILLIVFFSSSILTTILYRYVNPPLTPLMIIRCVEQVFSKEEVILKKDWVPLENISAEMQQAVVTAEDRNFKEHNGFDFDAIEKAYNNNQKGKKIKGGSTISQQTAKNVFLWQSRSWVRKGLEAYYTVLIEMFWSKKRIMEVYLNVIEMGEGIYGIEAASKKYFNKPAIKLNRGEAAFIASSLPNPLKFNPSKPTPYLLKRQQLILRLMGKR